MNDIFAQSSHRVRLEWGREGARRAAERRDIIVVVDVFRFTTTVATALQHGAHVYPCLWEDDAREYAAHIGAEAGGKDSRFSLSPLSFVGASQGTRVVLRSPNGATCARYASQVPYLFAGSLVNAGAVGCAVDAILQSDPSLRATILACGERWATPSEDGELRFAIEDYLGAGAVLSHIHGDKSPEARVCEHAFVAAKADLPEILRTCGSGIELIETNRGTDVDHASKLDLYRDCVPILRDGHFQQWTPRAD